MKVPSNTPRTRSRAPVSDMLRQVAEDDEVKGAARNLQTSVRKARAGSCDPCGHCGDSGAEQRESANVINGQGSTKICAPMPKTNPPRTAPVRRSTCLWREDPIFERPVSTHVVTEVLSAGQLRPM